MCSQTGKDIGNPQVSVVTPFFNAEPWLAECIESVLAQSFTEWEYLLVNNQSTDRSLEIAECFANGDSRIRVCNNPTFLNQIQNYNHALSLISNQSQYCKVVQADDWLFPECLDKMVALGRKYPSAGIISAYRLKGAEVAGSGLPVSTEFLTGKALARLQLIEHLSLFGSPSTILYRADLVRNRVPFFAEGRYHEDTDTCFELLTTTDFAFVHQVLTFTRIDNESITRSARHYNPGALDHYLRMVQFAPEFLSHEECRRELSRSKREYYLFLAQNAVRMSGSDFWDYHRRGLAASGLKLSRVSLIPFVLWVIMDLVLNPKDTVSELWRWVRRIGKGPA